ncbi:hypothetical protein [Nonomuraea sp. SYSU D8015]|uniref:hypothetical protein n=1 Tax=Nonomuraea sp. SYSU D8015 TaxID=2593644 RepID=UPI0016605939|nr:hypothetical protein [Nonomuraea sp. SYSU D8015]
MTDAKQWAALAREWLALSSPRAAKAMQEREQEAARQRRASRSGDIWRGNRADQAAARDLARVRWATEPEAAAELSPEQIEAAQEALARATALARARERARREKADRADGKHANDPQEDGDIRPRGSPPHAAGGDQTVA